MKKKGFKPWQVERNKTSQNTNGWMGGQQQQQQQQEFKLTEQWQEPSVFKSFKTVISKSL
jgi:hypothetical protein